MPSSPPAAPQLSSVPASRTTFVVDKRGIRDELVVAVMRHLELTNNTPITAKELSILFADKIDAVRNSPKPTVLVSSRLTAYLKRPWSALARCPLSKLTSDPKSRQISYYLTQHPEQPSAAVVKDDLSIFLAEDDNTPLDMEATMDDFPSSQPSRMDTDSQRSDSDDDLDLSDSSCDIGPDVKQTNTFMSRFPCIDADLLDPEFHSLDLSVLFGHSNSFPPLERSRPNTEGAVYALPLLEDIETEFHQAACKNRCQREAERQEKSGSNSAISPLVVEERDWPSGQAPGDDLFPNLFHDDTSFCSF